MSRDEDNARNIAKLRLNAATTDWKKESNNASTVHYDIVVRCVSFVDLVACVLWHNRFIFAGCVHDGVCVQYNLFRDHAVRRYSNVGVFIVILCQSNDNRTPYFNKTAEVCRNSRNELHSFDSLKDTWFIIQAFKQFSELSNVRRKYLYIYIVTARFSCTVKILFYSTVERYRCVW